MCASSHDPRLLPNLVDRLFLLLDGLQGAPSINHFFLTLDGALDPFVLREALGCLLAEQPVLASQVVRGRLGFSRQPLALDASDVADLVHMGGPAGSFIRMGLDFTRLPPLRLHLGPAEDAGQSRLVAGIHHSVVDGHGGLFALDRLAAHYTAVVLGTTAAPPPPGPPTRRYGAYLARLSRAERLRVALGVGKTLHELTAWAPACATFADAPLPSRGQLAWQAKRLDTATVDALRGWSRAHGGTLNDLLLAATAVAGIAVWPQPSGDPVVAMIPVSLREGAAEDAANRVAEVPVRLPLARLGNLHEAFEAVREATPVARDRVKAFSRICERAIASRLPPALVRALVATHLDRTVNRSFTLVFSNLGVLSPRPSAFGPVRVLAAGALPPLTMPPGLAVVASTLDGVLTLTFGHLEPAVAPASAARYAEAVVSLLKGLADGYDSRKESSGALVQTSEDC